MLLTEDVFEALVGPADPDAPSPFPDDRRAAVRVRFGRRCDVYHDGEDEPVTGYVPELSRCGLSLIHPRILSPGDCFVVLLPAHAGSHVGVRCEALRVTPVAGGGSRIAARFPACDEDAPRPAAAYQAVLV